MYVFQLTDSSQTKVADLEVNQFHFTDWPDHGVPSTTEVMLSFHECLYKQTLGTPLLVHCRYIQVYIMIKYYNYICYTVIVLGLDRLEHS